MLMSGVGIDHRDLGVRGSAIIRVRFSCRLKEVGRNLHGKVDSLGPNHAWSTHVSQFGKQRRASPFGVPDLHHPYNWYMVNYRALGWVWLDRESFDALQLGSVDVDFGGMDWEETTSP